MSTAAVAEQGTSLGEALRRMGGHATLGDVVAATGMPSNEAEAGLKKMLETCRGHLEVSGSGELLYKFDPGLVARDAEPFGLRFRRAAWAAFKTGFKIWTAVMLVVYFVVFVVLVIAAMTAGRASDRDGGFGGRRSGGFGLGDLFLMHWLLGGSGWRRGSLYYGDAHARHLPKEARPPFYKKVFAFIFGPEEPRPTQQQRDRSVLRLIRARRGVVTTAELVEHAALPLPEAEEEMARLTGAYGGDPRVSPKGEVVYTFPGLMKSAHGKVRAREPDPAWLRLEKPRKLTGNTNGSNLVIGGMNGFNLAAGFAIGLAPVLDTTGRAAALAVDPAVFLGLGVVPVVFSSMFFAIPACRALALRRENNARLRRNVRRVLVGLVCARSVGAVRWISLREASAHVLQKLQGSGASAELVGEELRTLAAEFGAEVETDDDGFRYRFPAMRAAFVEAELVRRGVKLEDWKPGQIVYSTSDSSTEASERDVAAFDRELDGAKLDLSRYLPSPNRIGYREDFDLVVDEAPVRGASRSRSRYPAQRFGSRRG